MGRYINIMYIRKYVQDIPNIQPAVCLRGNFVVCHDTRTVLIDVAAWPYSLKYFTFEVNKATDDINDSVKLRNEWGENLFRIIIMAQKKVTRGSTVLVFFGV